MLPEVTHDRVKLLLEAEELKYEVTDDERLVVHFESLIAFMRVTENLLLITGLWRADIVAQEDVEQAYLLVNKINTERTLPKAYVEDPTEEGSGSIVFEFNLPIDDGLSDEQLQAAFRNAMGSFFGAEAELAEALPHLVTCTVEDQGE